MKTTREKEITKVTLMGGAGNMLLLIFKFVAGWLGHSSAMIADAVHSLSDAVTDIVVLIFVKISAKPSDDSHDYGHGKFETLATSLVAISLFAVAVGIMVNAAKSIAAVANGAEIPRPGLVAFVAAVVSIAVKEALYWYTIYYGKKWNSQVVVANAWHHRSDALSSIATLVGVGFAYFMGDKWTILDPIAAVVVGAMLVKVSFSLLKPAIDELLERSLPEEDEKEMMRIVTRNEQVRDPHNLKTRRLGNRVAIEIHIRLNATMTVAESHDITVQIENDLKEKFGRDAWIMIHVEPRKD